MDIATEAPLLLDFHAADEKSAVLEVADLLKGHPAVKDHEAFIRAIWERQRIQSPILGSGIALPHARTDSVQAIVFAIGRCHPPVPFGRERILVNLVFLYGTPPSMIGPSLALIASLVKKLHRPEILAGLAEASDEAAFRKILA